MAAGGQKQGIGGGFLLDKLGQGNVISGPLDITADQFPPHRQNAAQGCQQKNQSPHQQAQRTLPQQGQHIPHKTGNQDTAQQMPDKQQLVVVVQVGLEHHKLGQQPERQPAAVKPALAFSGVEKGGDQQQEYHADVLDVKPEVIVPQGSVLVVDPVEMQADHVLAAHCLADHAAQCFRQPDRTAQQRQTQPGQKHPGGAGPAAESVNAADQADHHQRQGGVGLQQRQRQYQQGQRQPQPDFFLHHKPPQQIQPPEQHAPAEQGGALGDQQVHNGIDPDDIFCGVVGGGGVVAGKNGGKAFRTVEKIEKAESAAQKKEPESQAGLAGSPQHPSCQMPGHAVDRRKGRQFRQQIGGAQICPQQKKYAGHALAQIRVIQRLLSGQQRLNRRENPVDRNAFDVGQVHGQIPVAALSGVQSIAARAKNMGVQQHTGYGHQRQHTAGKRYQLPPVCRRSGSFCGRNPPARQKQQCHNQQRRDNPGTDHSDKGKAADQRKQGRKPCQQRHSRRTAKRQIQRPALAGPHPPHRQNTGSQKQAQIQNRNHKSHVGSSGCGQTPSRSKGGVYSSRALLFSCMYPSVSPAAMAASTTLRYS